MRPSQWIYAFPLWLRSLFRRRHVENELNEELRVHFDYAFEAGLARGLSEAEARREAMRRMAGIEQRKEECRDAWRVATVDSVRQDVRYALRALRKNPGFTLVAIGSLSLGIGANTAVFSLMDALLIRPLPVSRPGQLVLLSINRTRYSFSNPLFQQIRDRNTAFSSVFAWANRTVQVREGDDMSLVPAVYGSGDYFRTLAVAPQIGSAFGPDDDRPGGGVHGPVVVISDAYWTRKYARNPGIVGRAITINGVAVAVIGVLPPGFAGAQVGTAPDLWLPLNAQRQLGDDNRCLDSPSCWFLRVIGRLRPGVSMEQAATRLQVISRPSMEATLTKGMRADRKAAYLAQTFLPESGESGYSGLRERVKDPLQILMALVTLVLLIACANLANLLTARASARFREVGVRLAIGATRGRVIRQFLTESLVLAAAGAAGGWAFSLWSTRLLIGVLSTAENPLSLDLRPDWRMLLFNAAATIIAGFLFGIGPAFRATRYGLAATLKERTLQLRGGDAKFGLGKALMSIQVALSVVLLAAAGLFAGTLIRLMTLDPGFDPARLTIVGVVNSRPAVTGAAAVELFDRVLRRTRTMPGVESATLLNIPPISGGGWNNAFRIPGRPDLTEDQRLADINAVGTQFTETMRVPLLAGRDFNGSDTAQSENVALISENAARKWFPHGDALGNHIEMEGRGATERRIVGIVGNSKYLSLREELPFTVYVPYAQSIVGQNVAIRTRLPVRATFRAFRSILHEEAPAMPVGTIKTMKQQLDESLSTERLTAYLSVFIGVLALLLTSVGLYGILAYFVARRTGEIGIRMALGAQRPAVVWLVVRQVMGQTAGGIVAGIATVLAVSRVVRSLLYDVRPNDPATIASAVLLLTLVCLAAASLPARRAARLDPVEALREE